MSRSSRRNALALAVVAALIVSAYLLVWLRVDRVHIGLADFTATEVGATLLANGHRGDLYDDSVQAPLHAALIAPTREANLPFVNPPTAAALALPLAHVDLVTAYRVFSLFQFLFLASAMAVAVARFRPRRVGVGLALTGLAGLGSLALLLLGQWDGLLALGMAVALHLLLRGREATAGMTLGVTAAVAKPHLFLGVVVFLIGWRQRRVLAGALVGVVVIGVADLALVGPAGLRGMAAADARDASLWPLASLLGWNGFFGSWLGNGSVTQLLAGVGDLVALGLCAIAGDLVRRRPGRLGEGLAAAVVLSLAASPHLLAHDLVLAAPALAWYLAGDQGKEAEVWPGRGSRFALLGWLALNVALALDFGNQEPAPPGRLVPLVLMAAGAAATGLLRPSRAPVPS